MKLRLNILKFKDIMKLRGHHEVQIQITLLLESCKST